MKIIIITVKNSTKQERVKHYDVPLKWTIQQSERGQFDVQYIKTEHQLADILTKPLGRNRTAYLRGLISGYANIKSIN